MVARTLIACSLAAGLFPSLGGSAYASNWASPLRTGSAGEALSQPLPAAPSGPTAACASSTDSRITVSWTAVPHASSYKVSDSTTSATTGYAVVASGVLTTSWTTARLSSGNYWFQASALIGSKWTGPNSVATGESTVVVGISCVQP